MTYLNTYLKDKTCFRTKVCCKICFRTKMCYKTLCETSHRTQIMNIKTCFNIKILQFYLYLGNEYKDMINFKSCLLLV